MRDHERTLRRLAVSDDRLVAAVLGQNDAAVGVGVGVGVGCADARMRPLFRLAALIASEGPSASYQSVVESALAAGVSVEEVVDVLLAVAATVGSARVVAAAPILARVVGFDVDEAFDGDEAPSSARRR